MKGIIFVLVALLVGTVIAESNITNDGKYIFVSINGSQYHDYLGFKDAAYIQMALDENTDAVNVSGNGYVLYRDLVGNRTRELNCNVSSDTIFRISGNYITIHGLAIFSESNRTVFQVTGGQCISIGNIYAKTQGGLFLQVDNGEYIDVIGCTIDTRLDGEVPT